MPRPAELIIDVSGILDVETLHEYLSTRLNFFASYGYNFDAFWDCISDDELSIMPERLVVEGLKDLKAKLPKEHQKLMQCLKDYGLEFPKRQVIFVDNSPSGLGVEVPELEAERVNKTRDADAKK